MMSVIGLINMSRHVFYEYGREWVETQDSLGDDMILFLTWLV